MGGAWWQLSDKIISLYLDNGQGPQTPSNTNSDIPSLEHFSTDNKTVLQYYYYLRQQSDYCTFQYI